MVKHGHKVAQGADLAAGHTQDQRQMIGCVWKGGGRRGSPVGQRLAEDAARMRFNRALLSLTAAVARLRAGELA